MDVGEAGIPTLLLLPPPSCVTLNKSLKLSEPQFLIFKSLILLVLTSRLFYILEEIRNTGELQGAWYLWFMYQVNLFLKFFNY